MRVIGGNFRHRELIMPSSKNIRPTKDMVREAMFSVIGDFILNKTVLDLFAGSGSFSIESISRGAKYAYAVDIDKEAINTIKKNIVNLKINNLKIIKSDYLYALNSFSHKFDVVFLDPPYKMISIYQEVIDYLIKNKLLNENAIIILESDNILNINIEAKKIKDYNYGKTWVKIIWL